MRLGRYVLSMSALLTVAVAASAQEPRDPPMQEVFRTELVYAQERGEFQVDVGSSIGRDGGAIVMNAPLGIEYGLTDRWQIGVETTTRLTHAESDSSRLAELRVATKYSFLDIGGSRFHSAVGVEVGTALGDEGESDVEPFVCVARDFPSLGRLQIFGQLGVAFGPERDLEWSAGAFVPAGRYCLTAEVGRDREAGTTFTPGVVWRLPGSAEIGIGMVTGLGRGGPGAIIRFVIER